MPAEVSFTVPLVPPNVNNYVRHTRAGRHYVTSEAINFKESLFYCSDRKSVRAEWYEVDIRIFLGKGKRGDVDNFGKCVLDGLKEAGVIHSDAAVAKVNIEKGRDWENPRTEITVRAR